MSISTVNIDLFLLVFMRMTGLVIFNPVFGRTNIPNILKIALSLICAFIITPTLRGVEVQIDGMLQMMVAGLLELSVGLAIGVVVNLFFGVVVMAGEIIDMQMGLGMASMYDPASGVNMPIFGSLFNVMMTVVFFAGNAHLALFSMLSDSFKLIAPGAVFPTAATAKYIVSLGADLLSMGLRMAIPIMVIELVSVVAIGMLMKAVPQINIFNVGIQIEAIIGILMLLISSKAMVILCDRLTSLILEKSSQIIRLFVQ